MRGRMRTQGPGRGSPASALPATRTTPLISRAGLERAAEGRAVMDVHSVPHRASSGCFGGHRAGGWQAWAGCCGTGRRCRRDITMWGKISPQESIFPSFGWGWKARCEDLSNATKVCTPCPGLGSLHPCPWVVGRGGGTGGGGGAPVCPLAGWLPVSGLTSWANLRTHGPQLTQERGSETE